MQHWKLSQWHNMHPHRDLRLQSPQVTYLQKLESVLQQGCQSIGCQCHTTGCSSLLPKDNQNGSSVFNTINFHNYLSYRAEKFTHMAPPGSPDKRRCVQNLDSRPDHQNCGSGPFALPSVLSPAQVGYHPSRVWERTCTTSDCPPPVMTMGQLCTQQKT